MENSEKKAPGIPRLLRKRSAPLNFMWSNGRQEIMEEEILTADDSDPPNIRVAFGACLAAKACLPAKRHRAKKAKVTYLKKVAEVSRFHVSPAACDFQKKYFPQNQTGRMGRLALATEKPNHQPFPTGPHDPSFPLRKTRPSTIAAGVSPLPLRPTMQASWNRTILFNPCAVP